MVNLRTQQRSVQSYQMVLKTKALASMRFETPPGQSLQIDFSARRVEIGGAKIKAFMFMTTLGQSRRLLVRAFRREQQASWFSGVVSVFTTFGGVPEGALIEYPRARAHRIPRRPAVGWRA